MRNQSTADWRTVEGSTPVFSSRSIAKHQQDVAFEYDAACNLAETNRASRTTGAALLPVVLVVLVAFLIIGLAIAVLPLYVHHDLGMVPSAGGHRGRNATNSRAF
jgi:hypothetical protein